MEVGGQRHAPAALPPENTRYPLYRRLGGPQGLYGLARKISPHTCQFIEMFVKGKGNIDPRTGHEDPEGE